MNRKLMLIGAMIVLISTLSGCFGSGGDNVEEEVVKEFTEESALTRENKEELEATYKKIMDSDNEDIKSSDYIIKYLMSVDLDKDFFYGGILNMSTDNIYQQQLKYFEVHREYMKYLETNGASKEDMILNSRKFSFYLETFKGRQLGEKDHVKRALEKIFYKYSVLELDTIINDKSIIELVDSQREIEKENGMWDWLRKEENVNFKGDILTFTHVIFDLLEPSDKDVVEKYVKYIKEVDELVSQDLDKVKSEVLISNLNAIIEKVEKERINKEVEWIKKKVKNYIVHEINGLNMYYNKKEFDYAYEEFFLDIHREETLVTISLLEVELSKQEEKRKLLKESKENEKEKEKTEEK